MIILGVIAGCAGQSLRWGMDQQYANLAKSFLKGKLYFLETPKDAWDTVYFKGKYYWHQGPLPAMMMTPWVMVTAGKEISVQQGYVQLIISMFVMMVAFVMARKKGWGKQDAGWLVFALGWGSIYQMVMAVSWSAFLGHAISMLMIILACAEYGSNKRWWIIGIFVAGAFMSRFTAGMVGGYFVMEMLADKSSPTRRKIMNLISFGLPIIVGGIILLGYNQLRFGDLWNNGYMTNNISTIEGERAYKQRERGLFNIVNIPRNFKYYFLSGLDTNWKVKFPGTSFFIVSPIFLYMFKTNWRKQEAKLVGATMAGLVIILLMYYWSGWRQTGPRNLIDVLPLMWILLLEAFPEKKLPLIAKGTILFSAVLNCYLLTTVFQG